MGVQKVCGPTMKEKRLKDYSMYENTTSQYKNINQEKSFQIHLLFLHAILSLPANLEKLKIQNISTCSHKSKWDPSFIYKTLTKACIGRRCCGCFFCIPRCFFHHPTIFSHHTTEETSPRSICQGQLCVESFCYSCHFKIFGVCR